MARAIVSVGVLVFFSLALGCGAIEQPNQSPAQKKAIKYLESKGVQFQWHDPRGSNPPIEPGWHVGFPAGTKFSEADFEQLKHVGALKALGIRTEVSDGAVAKLADLDSLEEIAISGLSFTDREIDKIADIKNLQKLTLGDTKVTGQEGFKRFGHLRKLWYLMLYGTPISDDGLKNLDACDSLKTLSLSGTKITDDGLKSLKSLKNLELLHLIGEKVGDEGLKSLKGLQHLQSLDLSETQVTDAGMAVLGDFPALTTLRLRGTAVGNDGVKLLSRSKTLNHLVLYGTKIDNRGLAHIQAFENLTMLDLTNTKLSDEGMKYLRNSKIKHLTLWFDKKNFTDKGLEYLHELKTLKSLNFPPLNTNFTPEGLQRLQAALPELKLPSARKK